MNIDELRGLAERAEGVQGRDADRLTEVHARIRTARRRRAVIASSAAAGMVIVLVAVGAAVTGITERVQEPVDEITPTPTPTVEHPAGQTTLRPDMAPGDIGGWKLKAGRANTEPAFANAADLSLTVETSGFLDTGGLSQLASFCQGDPDTWWVLTVDLGGVEGGRNPDGSMQDGTRGMFGRCSQDAPTSLPRPTGPIDPGRRDEGTTAYPVRMFVTESVPAAARRCLGTRALSTSVGCPVSLGLVPRAETDATFGFGVFEPRRAPAVMDIPGLARLEALGMADGVEYLLDRAVLPAEGASRLVVRLPTSDQRRVLGFIRGDDTPALEECATRLGHGKPSDAAEERAQQNEFDRRCLTDLELRVDGARPPVQDSDVHFAEQQVVLPPGEAVDVTVEVVRNDPRNVRYALVIWEER